MQKLILKHIFIILALGIILYWCITGKGEPYLALLGILFEAIYLIFDIKDKSNNNKDNSNEIKGNNNLQISDSKIKANNGNISINNFLIENKFNIDEIIKILKNTNKVEENENNSNKISSLIQEDKTINYFKNLYNVENNESYSNKVKEHYETIIQLFERELILASNKSEVELLKRNFISAFSSQISLIEGKIIFKNSNANRLLIKIDLVLNYYLMLFLVFIFNIILYYLGFKRKVAGRWLLFFKSHFQTKFDYALVSYF